VKNVTIRSTLRRTKFGGLFQQEIGPADSRPYFQAKVAALDVARVAQPFAEAP